MKEIKFRQFINGKFHYWGLISEGVFNGMARYEDGYPESQQFTGLLDKNGKEIYEGDIIRYYLPNKQSFVDDIKWVRITTQDELDLEAYGFQFEKLEREVIGNIYENQDLLK